MKCILAVLLAFSPLLAEEAKPEERVEQTFGYFSAGLGPCPLLLPNFAGGFRYQSGHHGVDCSLQAATVVKLTAVQANLLYLHYFKPSLSSEFYVGGGIAPGVLLGNHHYTPYISPEFVFGKQYRNESNDLRFFQMQLNFPEVGFKDHGPWWNAGHVLWFPVVVISYGLGF